MIISTRISKKLIPIRDDLLVQYQSYADIKGRSSLDKTLLAMNCVVHLLNRAHCSSYNDINIVLKREFFSSIVINGRKQRKRVSYSSFRDIIDWLCDEHGCNLTIGGGKVEASFSTNLRSNSVLHLTDQVLSLFTPIIDNKYEKVENVLKVKDSNKKLITFPTTHKTDFIVASMDNYNELANNSVVTIDGERKFLQVSRVFNNSTFNNGGRIYTEGGDIQCAKVELAKTVCINGKITSELDFKSLHPSLLADLKGIAMDGHDPYMIDLEGYTAEVCRVMAKLGVMCAINCKSKAGAISALNKAINKNLVWGDLFKQGDVPDMRIPSSRVINQLIKHNPQLDDQWFKSRGIELQVVDSDIAMYVLNYFTDKGILLIPKHDSFIFDSDHIEEVSLVMKQSYLKVVGSAMNCRVEEK